MSLFDEISSGDHKEIIWNKNGLLFRKWNDETGDYYPEQMRIINKTISFTTDNWKTVRTAIGEYHYIDSKTGKVVETYGINAETIIGKLILGEQIELTNKNGSMVFNENGFMIDSESNGGAIFKISKNGVPVLYVDDDGNIVFSGSLKGATGTFSGNIEGSTTLGGTFTDCTYTGGSFKSGKLTSCSLSQCTSTNCTSTNDKFIDGTYTRGDYSQGTYTNGDFSNCSLSECSSTNCTSTNDTFIDGTYNRGTYTNGLFKDSTFENAEVSANNLVVEKSCYNDKYIINTDSNTVEYGDGLYIGILHPITLDGEKKYTKPAGILFNSSGTGHGDTEIYGNKITLSPTTSMNVKGSASIQNDFTVLGDTSLSNVEIASLEVTGDLNVSGTKSRLIHSDDGDFSLHAYETTTPYFGDIGTGMINSSGYDIVPIDYLFKNTIDTDIEYCVFLQKEGHGDLWVDEKDPLFFIVKGTPELKYSWELKAVQKDYGTIYMNEKCSNLQITSNDNEDSEVIDVLDEIIKQLDQEEEWIS